MPLDIRSIGAEQTIKQPPLVIYHANCMDGFTAAWACWLKFPDAEFVPGVYGEAPPNCNGRDVFLLDFSYKRNVMTSIGNIAKSVLILDHHKSAQEELVGLDNTVNVVFDMNKSGARLAWEWFHPGTEVPLFVRLVEDRDLWRFKLPDSKALNAAFFSYEQDFQRWNSLRIQCEDHNYCYVRLVEEGFALERKHMKDVKELANHLRHTLYFNTKDGGYAVPTANVPSMFASDVAGFLAEGHAFAATYYIDSKQEYVVSLRSKENGADVSIIAAMYGGGGHKHAAGFRVHSLDEIV